MKFGYLIFLCAIFQGCLYDSQPQDCYEDEIRKVCLMPHNEFFRLINIHAKDTTHWDLNYPVYKFLYEDISNDGKKNILVGVIKPTRFDSVVRKRLFIFKFYEEEIRPLWLGSRLGMPLEDFFVEEIDGENYIQTIEREKDGSLAIALYKWESFGFTFIEYRERNITNNKLNAKYETPAATFARPDTGLQQKQ